MARTNIPVKNSIKTHEGAPAKIVNAALQLRRSVLSCMLWENGFYENGQDIADRIKMLVHANDPRVVAELAIEAREKMKLRHVPLLLVRELARHKLRTNIHLSNVIGQVIQRADELCELVSIYWLEGRKPLSGQLKKGLAKAFNKFSEYDLAKYNRDNAVKLRDVLFLCHAKPVDEVQQTVWRRLVDNKLAIPDTWEVALSAGKDKRETWLRLLSENKLGGLALLRNLRNMTEVQVPGKDIAAALEKMKVDRVLPFRFVTAARFAPQLEEHIEGAMMRCLSNQEKLPGRTVLLIDVSGSMDGQLSAKSEATRLETACGLGILLREICEDVSIYTFSHLLKVIPARHGFALRDAITNSQPHGGTYLGQAVKTLNASETYDRLIVLTDEQSHDAVPSPKNKGYVINVGSDKNGVGYGAWMHIDGFSEAVIDYIRAFEHCGNVG